MTDARKLKEFSRSNRIFAKSVFKENRRARTFANNLPDRHRLPRLQIDILVSAL